MAFFNDAIKSKTDALQQSFYALSGKVYQNANPGAAAPDMGDMGGSMGGSMPNDDNVVDADFTEA